ncbi:transcriptional regulator, PadR family [Pseudonocardia ammonioxydans]|uniref:Transcriptional regulator, PadR family n=1 Tax=Pseudonocardia ammonioxydans TaxID=260086 RepID=A0A1I5DRK1_PSUAM|nr:PadR family transcriptional regulator [Pseudonocardia ammonioxydans]SFO01817.1 transcriptional regulator, PadR family [Pseudonocardia ammonioxydans]
MSLPHALLGLLAVGPNTGYELAKYFEGDLGRYAWQAGHTSVYPELNRMAGSGLIEVTALGPRGAKTYSVTDAGRTELRRWMMAPPADAKVRNEHVLRMFLISALPREDALSLLDRMAESTDESAAELRKVRAEHPDGAPMHGAEGFGQLAAEFGVRQYEAVRDWARWAADRLRAEG